MSTCSVCHRGSLRPGTTSYTFERDGHRLDVYDVPAEVCPACGEAWLDDLVAGQVLDLAAQARRASDASIVRAYEPV